MIAKFLWVFLFCFILLGSIFSIIPCSLADQGINSFLPGEIVYVDYTNVNGPWTGTEQFPFYSIQQAIENVSNGVVIYVKKGHYREHVFIDKMVTILGENKENTIIDGSNYSTPVRINGAKVSIKNTTITNSGGFHGDAGINCSADDCFISDCVFFRTKTGVICQQQENMSITDCFFYGNGDGIQIHQSQKIDISHNVFTHNSFGIVILDSSHLSISSNDATVNGIALYMENTSSVMVDHCAMYNNNDNQGGIFLEQCWDVVINNSHIVHNGFGIKTEQCNDICISHCSLLFNTHAGFFIKRQSSDIIISDCDIAHNLRNNIYIKYSSVTQFDSNNYDAICTLYSLHSDCDMSSSWWGSCISPVPFQLLSFPYYFVKESNVIFSPVTDEKYDAAGAQWSIDKSRGEVPDYLVKPVVIEFTELDSDGDGVPDVWESTYGYDPLQKNNHSTLDPDHDGLTNIEECYAEQWGAHPFEKDVFWELDWMRSTKTDKTNKPDASLLAEIKQAFADHNISLHVDTGELGGGEEIPYEESFSIVDLRDYYWAYFLHNDINNPRKGIFHYGFICDDGPSAGNAFFGWDNLDSFIVSADKIGGKRPSLSRERFIVGGAVHELGHTLALTVDDHRGNDNTIATLPFTKEWLMYLPYRSCMNYWYTYEVLVFSDGNLGPTDFDDWHHMDLSFFKNTHFDLPNRFH